MQKKDERVTNINLARTFAVYEDEGHNIARRKAAQEDSDKKRQSKA